jgi:hypothetical protein
MVQLFLLNKSNGNQSIGKPLIKVGISYNLSQHIGDQVFFSR